MVQVPRYHYCAPSFISETQDQWPLSDPAAPFQPSCSQSRGLRSLQASSKLDGDRGREAAEESKIFRGETIARWLLAPELSITGVCNIKLYEEIY